MAISLAVQSDMIRGANITAAHQEYWARPMEQTSGIFAFFPSRSMRDNFTV